MNLFQAFLSGLSGFKPLKEARALFEKLHF